MRRIRVKEYERQDGTIVRAHEKNVTSSPGVPPVSTLDLFSLEQIVEEERPVLDSSYPEKEDWQNAKDKMFEEQDEISRRFAEYREDQYYEGGKPYITALASLFAVPAGFVLGGPILGIPAAAAFVAKFVWDVGKPEIYKFFALRNLRKKLSRTIGKPSLSWSKIRELAKKYPSSRKRRRPLKEILFGEKSYSRRYYSRNDSKHGIKSRSRIKANGTGSIKVIDEDYGEAEFEVRIHPGLNLEEKSLNFAFNVPGANLRYANFHNVVFEEGLNFNNADLRGANLSGAKLNWNSMDGAIFSTMCNTDLRGANLEGADLQAIARVEGTSFEGANITNTHLPKNLRGAHFSREQLKLIYPNLHKYVYDQVSFSDALKELDITEKQFEFLVVSGVVEVRSNDTKEKIVNNFDPDAHHVPKWEIETLKHVLGDYIGSDTSAS